MIDPATLCSVPGHTDDPGFVTRDYSTHRQDNAARKFFLRVGIMLLVIDGAALIAIGGRVMSWW